MHVQVLGCLHPFVRRPETDVWHFPVPLSALFYQTGTLIEPGVWHFCRVTWLVTIWGPRGSALSEVFHQALWVGFSQVLMLVGQALY